MVHSGMDPVDSGMVNGTRYTSRRHSTRFALLVFATLRASPLTDGFRRSVPGSRLAVWCGLGGGNHGGGTEARPYASWPHRPEPFPVEAEAQIDPQLRQRLVRAGEAVPASSIAANVRLLEVLPEIEGQDP